MHAGKFNEALESLLTWMKETEDMVANQKAPSFDYKVLKAQLQEQKVLKVIFVLNYQLSKYDWYY